MDGWKRKEEAEIASTPKGAKGNCKFIPEYTERGDPWAIFGVIRRRKEDDYVPGRGRHFGGRRGPKKAKLSRTGHEFFLI